MKLYLDLRERALHSFFPECVPRNLDIGDIQIVHDDDTPLVVIERKTFSDFYQSCRDGRYREQKQRLRASAFPFKWYLFEGISRREGQGQFDDDYWAHLTLRLTMKDGFWYHVTSSTQESAHWIQLLFQKMQKQSHEFLAVSAAAAAPIVVKPKKKDNYTPLLIYQQQLQQIPGVATQIATALSSTYCTMRQLIQALEERPHEVSELMYGAKQRRLGTTMTDRLKEYLL